MKLKELQSQVSTLGECLAANPLEREEAVREFNFYRAAWKTRKDKVKSLVEMLAEGMEKSVKETMVGRLLMQCVGYSLIVITSL